MRATTIISRHPSTAYADFDPATSIARGGMGSAATGAALVGNTYDVGSATDVLQVRVSKSGPFSSNSVNSIFGIRIDFQNKAGVYNEAVLYTDGKLYNAQRTLAMPWGTSRAVPDAVETYSGSSFQIDLAGSAPIDWNGKRIVITPLLVDAGTEPRARIEFKLAAVSPMNPGKGD